MSVETLSAHVGHGFWHALMGRWRREPAIASQAAPPRTEDPLSAGYQAVERLGLLDSAVTA